MPPLLLLPLSPQSSLLFLESLPTPHHPPNFLALHSSPLPFPPLPLPPILILILSLLPSDQYITHIHAQCSVSLFLYMAMTQWHLDASSVGSLTLPELLVLWTTCMACVKFLPLVSIGLKKILSNPRKYLLQTSFYAQGVIPGAVAAIIIIATWRGVNPLLICDGLCMFVLQGELIGRLGCHFYGCCFGMPANDGSVKSYNRFSVVYFHKASETLTM